MKYNTRHFQESRATIQRQKQEQGLFKTLFSQEKVREDLSGLSVSQHTDEIWHEIPSTTMYLLRKCENKMQFFQKKTNLWLRQSFTALWLTRNAGRPWQTSDGELIWVWIQRLEYNNSLITTILILYRTNVFYITHSFNFVITVWGYVEAFHVMIHFTLWRPHSRKIFKKRFFCFNLWYFKK